MGSAYSRAFYPEIKITKLNEIWVDDDNDNAYDQLQIVLSNNHKDDEPKSADAQFNDILKHSNFLIQSLTNIPRVFKVHNLKNLSDETQILLKCLGAVEEENSKAVKTTTFFKDINNWIKYFQTS